MIVELSPASVDAVARRVLELQREMPAAPAAIAADPLLTREEAARFCNLTLRTFDRERKRVGDKLAPAATEGPLARRWRKSALDLYILTTGRAIAHRRGPKPRAERLAA